jgi:PPK2 family polyphosphate:nucleotide phosphotransferase
MSYIEKLRVKPRSLVSLLKLNAGETGGIGKHQAEELLTQSVARMAEVTDRLYAQKQWSLLIVLQAMDAAGKDGTIKHVTSGLNPQWCRVTSFGAPSTEDLAHDYLWRIVRNLPERGCIGIHNRSHYEEVIVTRVHARILQSQRLPETLRGPDVITRRYKQINRFEKYLMENGTVVLKFFLHVSKREQWRRLRERMEDPEKWWKLQPGDMRERLHWDKYMAAYEDAFRYTSTAHAPWFVIPGDNKFFARLAVAEIINETLSGLNLHYPQVTDAMKAEWEKAREELRSAQ